jgi:NAD(P)-dependent dehydrogenase (short-subunit alcohol dehydrogenase family)
LLGNVEWLHPSVEMSRRIAHVQRHLVAGASWTAQPLEEGQSASGLQLEGMAAVVTGAGGGIGEASAMLFANQGANCVCVDINVEAAAKTADQINQKHGKGTAIAVKADVADEAQSQSTVDKCIEAFGRLDVYFANAGILGRYTSIEDTTLEAFERTMRVNCVGVFLAIKHASIAMKQLGGGGSIICTASIAAIRADVTPLEYTASKAAVVAIVRSAADRLILDEDQQRTNIRVNAIMPGGVITSIALGVATDIDSQEMRVGGYDFERFPPAMPSQIAEVALFLARPSSSGYVNGQVL